MPVALPIRCIFLAFVTTVISPLGFAKMYTDSDKNDAYSPYTLYMQHCNKTQEQVDFLEAQKGPLDPQQVVKSLTITSYSLSADDYTPAEMGVSAEELARCNATYAKADKLWKQAKATLAAAQAIEDKKQKKADLIAHQNLPEYKQARGLGFKDVGNITFLKMYDDMVGDAELKSTLINVDQQCGKYLRATQYVEPYVIYTTAPRFNGPCGSVKKFAIRGTRGVNSGDWINPDAQFRYVGWQKILAPNGFKIRIQALEQL
ncbi:hypothetical protein JOE33_002667 [Pseudomonas sp. PvP027]|uniref:hypothetical protein n=1 Tax=Pseudomonas TaxID=286 RepID=UPI0016558A1B|nr:MULTISPECIES: hypothetical protein [Pseudomonas]MBC8803149.1 hypothetical protein [Pseudomonas congelans]MBP1145744.1 hypothetical protein [Pseudomonas sp. PvP027]